tara:strand:- start:234 stop:920 length:687 start_codon:yes stop_codon:yes gene_type:complete
MSFTDSQKNIKYTCVDKHGWKNNADIRPIFIKICIDKFLSKKKKIPIELLADYKKETNDIRSKLSKVNLKAWKKDNEKVEGFDALLTHIYNSYKYKTERERCFIKTPDNSFDNTEFSGFILQKEDAVCFTYNKGVKKFNWLDKADVGNQFKTFKKGLKKGDLTCDIVNNKSHMLGVGKWFSLCVQINPVEENSLDAGACHVFRYMVSGCVYFFQNKKNRNDIYEYLNK